MQNFSRAASAASGDSGVTSRSGGRILRDDTGSPVIFRHTTTPPVALKGKVELAVIQREIDTVPQKRYHSRRTSTGLRTVKSWKSARPQKPEKPVVTSEADEPVARRSTRRKKPSRRASMKDIFDSSENPTPPKVIQPLTAPILKALESEVTRSSSLEMEISTPPGVVSGGESAFSQTSESSSRKFREQNQTDAEAKTTDAEVKDTISDLKANDAAMATNAKQVVIQNAPSTVSKTSGSWKGALRSVRDTFRKKSSTTNSSLSTKVSHESPISPKTEAINSLLDNLTPGSPAMGYLTAPDTAQSPIAGVQAEVRRLQMLETVNSEPENEKTLLSDTDTQKSLSKLNVDKVLQEVSVPSLPQPAEDPNTISGMGEMASWDSTIARRKKRTRAYKTGSKQRKSERRPVAGVFKPATPRRESPLKPVSPLRVVKEKTQATVDETIAVTNPTRSEPGPPLGFAPTGAPTPFQELSLPISFESSVTELQKEHIQGNKQVIAVASAFESLSDLTTPPPAKPPQEVRSPTLMREMAFPSLRLRADSGDASMEKKYFSEDRSDTVKPAPKRQVALERNSVPKKRIFGDADWRTDRNVSRGDNADETSQKLQELQEVAPQHGQKTNLTSGAPEPDFTTLPRDNYILLASEPGDSGDEYGDMVKAEVPFLKYTVNPPFFEEIPQPVYPPYHPSRKLSPWPLMEGTSVMEVSVDGKDEMVTRGRRRRRAGS